MDMQPVRIVAQRRAAMDYALRFPTARSGAAWPSRCWLTHGRHVTQLRRCEGGTSELTSAGLRVRRRPISNLRRLTQGS